MRGLHPAAAARIRSRVREGTSVQIYLPRAIETATFGTGRTRPARAAGAAHILVVDDDPDVRWIIAQDLQEIGYVVTEADSGRAALAILEQDAPCDLMVADLVMPGLSGLDTMRLARRTRPDLKVLFASGYADLSRFGSNLSSHTLLKKPFKAETLAEAVQTALQRVSAGEPDNIVQLRRDQL